ncbi:hypothetical protein GPECTOR_32g534 [Gonium pectorale]|uniref:methenyltetrahydrofolate cyclohydrolase n=1 Tax=Gonium pectorale TaxID=33097 RepID=A0A150GDI8_GONPE|nr:hypothetical protein GPECTOR_32g534 [Gonium pectorale]|eukprot:KXZ47921.1 hypothetical protein GPECTOR_32g534 [Gonium pectorale]
MVGSVKTTELLLLLGPLLPDVPALLPLEGRSSEELLGRPPGLGVVLVGNRPDSMLYVAKKQEACQKAGMYTYVTALPAGVGQAELEAAVSHACGDCRLDGLLIQLPLPGHLSEEAVMEVLDPRKDVDGFHPLNMGRMLMRGRGVRLVPATPLGCMELLRRSGVEVKAAAAADAAAAAAAAEMAAAGDSGSLSYHMLPDLTRTADILVVAVGHPELVRADWVKPGAVVIDVGINVVGATPRVSRPQEPHSRTAGEAAEAAGSRGGVEAAASAAAVAAAAAETGDGDACCEGGGSSGGGSAGGGHGIVGGGSVSGGGGGGACVYGGGAQNGRNMAFRVVGDVAFDEVSQVAGAITPVPGGVGPMTIAAVLHNTIKAAKYRAGLEPW